MKMLNDSVLVMLEAEEKETTTMGGIILTGTPDDDQSSKPATVLAVADSVEDVVVGDVIYLSWVNSIPITVEGKKLNIVPAENIKVVL
jgi:co-chaperonin GroES (HSP10)